MKTTQKQRLLYYVLFLLLVSIFTILLWVLDETWASKELSVSLWQRYFGQLTGLLGIIFLSLNYILSTRLRFIERLLGGLDKLYMYHIVTGITGYILIFLHPLLLASRYFGNLDVFSNYYIINKLDARGVGILAFWLLTVLVLAAGYKKIPYHIWKLIHRLMGLPLILIGLHAFLMQNQSETLFILRIWIIAWIIMAFVSRIYKELLYNYIGPVYSYTVSTIEVKGDITEIKLMPVAQKIFKYVPGQFIFLKFLDNSIISSEQHPYTLSSCPTDNFLRISSKKLGDWSSKLSFAMVNNKVKIWGPYGQFTLSALRKSEKVICIAGGIGITPFLSIIREEVNNPIGRNLHLIYSCKNETEAVYLNEIKELIANVEHIKLTEHFSDTQGFMNAEYIDKTVGGFQDAVFMLCGPMQMLKAIRNQLKEVGVRAEDIVYELFEFR